MHKIMLLFSNKESNNYLHTVYSNLFSIGGPSCSLSDNSHHHASPLSMESSEAFEMQNLNREENNQSFQDRNDTKNHIYEPTPKLDLKSTEEKLEQSKNEEIELLKSAKKVSKALIVTTGIAFFAAGLSYIVLAWPLFSSDKGQNNNKNTEPTTEPTGTITTNTPMSTEPTPEATDEPEMTTEPTDAITTEPPITTESTDEITTSTPMTTENPDDLSLLDGKVGITGLNNHDPSQPLTEDSITSLACPVINEEAINPDTLCQFDTSPHCKERIIVDLKGRETIKDTAFCQVVKNQLSTMLPAGENTYVFAHNAYLVDTETSGSGDDTSGNDEITSGTGSILGNTHQRYIDANTLADQCTDPAKIRLIARQINPDDPHKWVAYLGSERINAVNTISEQNRQHAFLLNNVAREGTDHQFREGVYATYVDTPHGKQIITRKNYCDANRQYFTLEEYSYPNNSIPRDSYINMDRILEKISLNSLRSLAPDWFAGQNQTYIIQEDETARPPEEDPNSTINVAKYWLAATAFFAVFTNVTIFLPIFRNSTKAINNIYKGVKNIHKIDYLRQKYADGSIKASAPQEMINGIISHAKDTDAVGLYPVLYNINGKLEEDVRVAHTFIISHKNTFSNQFTEGRLYKIKDISYDFDNHKVLLHFESINNYAVSFKTSLQQNTGNSSRPNTLTETLLTTDVESAQNTDELFVVTKASESVQNTNKYPNTINLSCTMSDTNPDTPNVFNIIRDIPHEGSQCYYPDNTTDITDERVSSLEVRPVFPYEKVTNASVSRFGLLFSKDPESINTIGFSEDPMFTFPYQLEV